MAAYKFEQNSSKSSNVNRTVQFCSYCGAKLDEGARFCKKCGEAVIVTLYSDDNNITAHPQQNLSSPEQIAENIPNVSPSIHTHINSVADDVITERKTVFEGEIHKCPNCGEVLESFVVNCPSCGYEFRGAKNSSSVREFAAKLEAIEEARTSTDSVSKKKIQNQTEVSETDKKKISLIRSFAIPNTKEDLFEFLILASSNINIQRYGNLETISESEKKVSDAWAAKFEQAYEKAKLSFGHTHEFKKMQSIYDKKNAQITNVKKKDKKEWFLIFCSVIIPIGFLWGLVFFLGAADDNKIAKENERLDAIVEEVYCAIENENYVLARAKAANLVFAGSTTDSGKQASEKWDKTRTELLAIIDSAAGEAKIDIPQGITPSSSEEKQKETEHSSLSSNSLIIPDDFIAGYEKAEFTKYNSSASENGLGGRLIYIVGTLDKTEVLTTDGTQSVLGYITDEDGKTWLVMTNIDPIVTEGHFSTAIGKTVVCTVQYEGYSENFQMPSATLNELLILEDGTIISGKKS